MVRLFNRPSRSYASTATPYLDPTSSYPIMGPMDDEYPVSEGGSSRGRARWEDGGVNGSPHGSIIESRDGRDVRDVREDSHTSVPAKKKKKKKQVHTLESPPEAQQRPGPSSLFNGSHTSSSHKIHPLPTPTNPTKRNRQLSEAMKTFSAMDLAPPPPKPRSGGSTNGSEIGVLDRHVVGNQVNGHANMNNTSPTLTYTSVFSSDEGRPDTRSQASESGSSIVSNKPSKSYASTKSSPLHQVSSTIPSNHVIGTTPIKSSVAHQQELQPPRSPVTTESSRDSIGDMTKRMASTELAKSPLREEKRMEEVDTQHTPIANPPIIEQNTTTFVSPPPPPLPDQLLSISPPSFSIQPPTPSHDVEATPFHEDSLASPLRREGTSSGVPGGMVALGAPIGQKSFRETREDTEGTHESQGWGIRPPLVPAMRQSAVEEGLQGRPTPATPTIPTSSNSPPDSDPNSQPGSSNNSRQSSSDSIRDNRQVNAENHVHHHLQPSSSTSAPRTAKRLSSRASDGSLAIQQRPHTRSVKSSSRSDSPVWRGPVQPPISVPFLPPSDPSQPSYLRWDPAAQRWIPTSGATVIHDKQDNNARLLNGGGSGGLSRAGSVISSAASSYSQASAAPTSFGNAFSTAEARRASLPHVNTSGMPLSRPYISPSPSGSESGHSRPTSPSHSTWRSPLSAASAPPTRRMSIEPAYSLSPTMLTFLPEMSEQQSLATMHSSSSRPSSRPPSRSHSRPSSVSGGNGSHLPTLRPSSSASHYRTRNSAGFPSGYDVEARAWAMSNGDRPQSDGGDVVSNGGTASRPSSPQGGSQFEGFQHAPRPASRAASRAGRDSAHDTISARGDPVPLLGADGTTGEGLGGYTSLVLPTGSYKPSDPSRDLDKIDPRVLGMPTTTMSTITINAATGASRRNSFAGHRRSETPTPAHLLTDQPAPVSFSSHQPPPSKISPSQVLVQVYTVALDRTDLDMVREKAANGSGAGKWVPGRSFCGRALDVGADVRTIVKGDLVMGLVDVKKSGMLAEYITCDRRRIARTPTSTDLSIEQLACLPLLGVLAHRAASHCTSRGSRALILDAHEGVGALVCQELSAQGINVIAHAPASILGAEDDCWENGAREVFLDDDEVGMINDQHESGFEFVLDTVGGRRAYDAARRVLRTGGVFVTLYGDAGPTPTPSSPLKSSLHSLRRAFVRKDKKTISYIHLAPGSSGTVVGGSDVDPSGLDSRDILELGVMRRYRPKVGVVLPFERAGEGLEIAGKGGAGGGDDDDGDEWEGTGQVVIRLIN